MPKITSTKDIEFKYNLGLYFGFLKKYKLLFGLLLLVGLLLEIKNLGEKYLLKLLIDNGGLFEAGEIGKGAFVSSLWVVFFYYLILFGVSVVLYWFRPHLINRLMLRTIVDMKRRFFGHILDLDHNFHTTHKTGSLISRLTRGTSAMERMAELIHFNFVPLAFQLLVIIISVSYFDVSAVVIIIGTCFAHISYSIYIQRLQEESSIDANIKEDIEKGNMADFFTNVDSIKN
jgi:ABC-type multidrug transport system fused ATPase/permease subunit